MDIIDTRLKDVKLLKPRVFEDDRGYFMETWNRKNLTEAGLDIEFVQDNESFSLQGALRGIHAQLKYPQGKLARVTQGAVFDVAIDLRPDSEQFGQWVGVELSAENKQQLWIPPGFGHAYLTLSETAVFNYKCTDYYHGDDQAVLAWDDPSVGIDWPTDKIPEVLLSQQDQQGLTLQALKDSI